MLNSVLTGLSSNSVPGRRFQIGLTAMIAAQIVAVVGTLSVL